jgi:cytochrome c oxidase subunit 2
MSTSLIIILCFIFIVIVLIQIGRVTELAGKIRGEEEVQYEVNRRNGIFSMIFLVGFLLFCVLSAAKYKNWILWYGPHEAASEHGGSLDSIFNTTLFFTGIVFVLTHIALFYFSYKYAGKKGQKASFISHDNKLEVIWTAIPAVVMCFLVIKGLVAWNAVMADIPETHTASLIPQTEEEYIEIEATGAQFLWFLRYPGADGKLGERNYKMINGTNPLGQDWTDEKNLDDFHPSEIVLPKGKQVRVRITARDVLHNFYLPHFRVKMDAVPGIPTYFVFTPKFTTEEYRQKLKGTPEYEEKLDPNDPESLTRWEAFEYELACAELCGTGHYSMRKLVKIVEQDEYEEWLKAQQSYYLTTIAGTDQDPWPINGELPSVLTKARSAEFMADMNKAMTTDKDAERIVLLKYVMYDTGKSSLDALSRYQLNDVAKVMKDNPDLRIELRGHTDSQGDDDGNMALSQSRSASAYSFLVDKGIAADRMVSLGFGETLPLGDNATEEGRQLNRRTELKVIAKDAPLAEAVNAEGEGATE